MSTLFASTKNFYLYQKERFPIVVLGLTLLPAILSSGAVIRADAEFKFVLTALIASVMYLLHVRIIDEIRDYEHDQRHHKHRPLSVGIITLKELKIIDLFAVIVLLLTSLFSSPQASLFAVVMLIYSYLSQKEFFLGFQLKRHFFLYNSVNLVQMLMLQILVYIFAKPTFSFTNIVVIHFLFTMTGTIIFEFLRKVRSPGNDGTGRDTYTWFFGYSKALLIYAVFATLITILFLKAMFLIQTEILYWIPIVIVLVTGVCSTLFFSSVRKEEKTNQAMQLSFMIMYGGFNILLFLAL